jgi:hypothetical protein
MSEYTQVGVCTQAQPSTHLNQPWPSVWGEIPIIEPNEGYGRVIQTPLKKLQNLPNCAARRLSAEALLRLSHGQMPFEEYQRTPEWRAHVHLRVLEGRHG